jgi:hypothetical protein
MVFIRTLLHRKAQPRRVGGGTVGRHRRQVDRISEIAAKAGMVIRPTLMRTRQTIGYDT